MMEMYRDSLSPKEQLMKDVSKIGGISNQEIYKTTNSTFLKIFIRPYGRDNID